MFWITIPHDSIADIENGERIPVTINGKREQLYIDEGYLRYDTHCCKILTHSDGEVGRCYYCASDEAEEQTHVVMTPQLNGTLQINRYGKESES